jgi:hypothetical protein
MWFCIITPAEDPCLWNISGEKILEPINVILGRPGLLAFPIQAMDRDDTMMH